MNRPPQNASAPLPPPLHEHRITRTDVLAAAVLGAILALAFFAFSWWRATPSPDVLPTPIAVTPVAATMTVETTGTPPAAVQVVTTATDPPSLPPLTPTVALPVAGNGGLLGGGR